MSFPLLETRNIEAVNWKTRIRTLQKKYGTPFLLISLAIHILFLAGAGFYVVHVYQGKRKQTFAAGPKLPNAPQRALEHKVQMQKKTKCPGSSFCF